MLYIFLLFPLILVASTNNKWIVYRPTEFDTELLCSVLNCRKHEVCIVDQQNSAFCIKKHKINQIDGLKFYPDGKLVEDVMKKMDGAEYEYKLRQHQENIYEKEQIHKNKKSYGRKIKSGHNHKHRNRQHEHECDEKELLKMGGRLLQWFTDVHSHAEINLNNPLPKHHVSCRADVSWMFQQWDGDENGELTADELRPLDEDKQEMCLSPFLDRCDSDADDSLSLDEWCDCFGWSDDVRHEPPCHRHKHLQDPHLLGVFHPRCDVDGYYKAEQCHEQNCWCVDKFGREFDNSRVVGKMADCGQYAELDPNEVADFGPKVAEFDEIH